MESPEWVGLVDHGPHSLQDVRLDPASGQENFEVAHTHASEFVGWLPIRGNGLASNKQIQLLSRAASCAMPFALSARPPNGDGSFRPDCFAGPLQDNTGITNVFH